MAEVFIPFETLTIHLSVCAKSIAWIVSQLLAFGISVYLAVQMNLIPSVQDSAMVVGFVAVVGYAISFTLNMILMLL